VDEPAYARIAAQIRGRIAAGELRPGDRVPSTRQLVRDSGVARATATKALTALRQEGLVQAVPGVGTVVAAPAPGAGRPLPSPPRPEGRRLAGRRAGGPTDEEALTRERVVRAAIAVADAEGLSGLTMRGVAARLGVATMSLYRHVPGKDDLVLLMVDAAYGETPPPSRAAHGWRARLELSARLQWTLFRRHPWLAQAIMVTRPQLLPNAMAHTEWALRALAGHGLDLAAMLTAHVALFSYVRGIAINLEVEAQARQDTGVTSAQWMAAQDGMFASIAASGRFPLLSRVAAVPDIDMDLDTLFEFGLQRMLDGLGVFLRQTRHRLSPAAAASPAPGRGRAARPG
jgi:AcrR family transcriptional regulator